MTAQKIVTIAAAARIADAARRKGKKVITTNGCFDIIHVGHVRNLQAARKLGDLLMVGINSDASVRQNKGALRPIVPARERAEVLAALACVDYVFIFSGKSPIPWMRKIRPSVHVKGKGSERSPAFAAEKSAVEEGGGKVFLAPQTAKRSTTAIIETVVRRYKGSSGQAPRR